MPLLTQEKLHQAASWALWHIGEEEEEEAFLDRLFLSATEQKELACIKLPQRRLEWLASRLLIKQLAAEHQIRQAEIIKDSCGKPQLNGSSCYISLSHAFPYAAAILHEKQAVGIDIEKPRPQLLRVQHKFLNENELLCAREDPQKLCVYWAAKEALYKLYGKRGLIFGEQIIVHPFQLGPEGELQAELIIKTARQAYSLHYRSIDDLIVCFSL